MRYAVLAALLLVGCASQYSVSESPHAKTIDQARAMSNEEICFYSNQGALFEKEVVKERKPNCKKILDAELRRQLKTLSNASLCFKAQEANVKPVQDEVKSRNIDCYQTLSLYNQQEQIRAMQDANRVARSNALLGYSAQMQSINNANRRVNTSCINTPMGMNCSTY